MTDQQIAESNTILRCVVGSTLHGLAVSDGLEDRDEMGIFIEPPECVLGLRRFEHWVYRTSRKACAQRRGIWTWCCTACANGCGWRCAAARRFC